MNINLQRVKEKQSRQQDDQCTALTAVMMIAACTTQHPDNKVNVKSYSIVDLFYLAINPLKTRPEYTRAGVNGKCVL